MGQVSEITVGCMLKLQIFQLNYEFREMGFLYCLVCKARFHFKFRGDDIFLTARIS